MERIRRRLVRACKKAFNSQGAVFGEGPCPCDIMIIGEAPGRVETKLKRPFTGRSGRFFVDIAEGVLNRKREDIYISNAVKIWPRKGTKRGRTRPPTESEKRFFLPYLYEEVRAVSPHVVVTVGKAAFSALLPEERFAPGRWFESKEGFYVMPVYHPAYMLRRQRRMKELVFGLKKALKEVKKKAGAA